MYLIQQRKFAVFYFIKVGGIIKDKKFVFISLILVVFFLSILSISIGKVNIFNENKEIGLNILLNLRLPRIIMAMFVGASLAVSGAVFQSLLNNPLADSYTLGVSSGAALGACIAIYLNLTLSIYIPPQILSIVFSILVLFIVLSIANVGGFITNSNIILAGLIVSSVCQAGVSLLKSMANENASAMVYWLLGNLSAKSIKEVIMLIVFSTIGILICFRYSREINIMTLGRKEAIIVGVDYDKTNKILLINCSIITAICVSLCGIIGFIGIIVPHLIRILVGADNRKVIPLSSLLGAILLLSADTLTRTVFPHEIPVGVFTTLIGGPFFCYIFVKRNSRTNI
ncbi:hemin transport system permease protein HmuU [Clostridium acetireducens DSM 10703]|uniref:Hemin transport system permease protein HmuU n=1 Tax=Clostridium acetireducens DSM 10703 TaxID=1121290 RepID=A0A1E8F0L4_9CLOT|nr:iron ABC transporter permease [Clostridium acetireducens]OFI06681.1 hemin transport system permease protein HmuU [Clostridium acetireducens DSM 10703]